MNMSISDLSEQKIKLTNLNKSESVPVEQLDGQAKRDLDP